MTSNMYRLLILPILLFTGLPATAQSYNDLFTTYKSVPTQPQRNKQSSGGYNYVPQYQTIDPNQFYQSIAPQNVQMVNGVFLYQGQFYSIKLRVGVSGIDPNQIVVCGFWDGQNWHNITTHASKIGTYGVPEQIRMACTHQAYIQSIGTIYF